GQFIGEAGIAAVNAVIPVTGVILFFAAFLSNGIGIIYPREIGAMRQDRADKIYGQGLILSISTGIILCIIVFLIKDFYFSMINISGDILINAQQYYIYAPINALLTVMLFYLEEMIYSDGDTLCTNICYVLQIGGNIAISIILVGSMGMSGIMLGTVIGNGLGIIVCCWHYFRKCNSLHFVWHLSLEDFLQTSRYSIVDSITVLNWAFMIFVITGFISSNYGDLELTVFAIVISLIEFSAVLDGIGVAIQPLIGTYYAEGNHVLIKRVMKAGIIAAIIEGAVATVLICIFARQLCGVFGIVEGEALIPSINAVRMVALGFIFCSIILLMTSYYNLIDKIGMSVLITILLNGVLYILFPIIGSILWGVDGMWSGYALAPIITLAGMFFIMFFRYGRDNFPFLLKSMTSLIRVFDDVLTHDNTAAISAQIQNLLVSMKYSSLIANRAALFAEEIGETIIEKNKNKKEKIYIEFSLFFEPDSVLIIERDSGELFDITDPNLEINGLSSFILGGLMESHKEKKYQITTGYNRNMIRIRENTEN
ncbi:MAG: hypothetical protein K6G03_08575, partial [Lachnospiraceae bacterium]|nr:hypothetical protein [Lachnospiraceae bacterium]